ncbi:unnamed protein product (macronuclear) [Paramecium tetraurelia]|uniref:SPRY domain-containing protein n=1 Tax=Paramecium tetraurelia TaxID=5888 RepID=A0CZJ3_PARTE|nr:uncharacterized protein GSPATT00011783001 [Paramecium tetraurelia]CAK76210.1 unnamed protein product [Paramecium tetraurelia]|eukprot:XP_001443607.1 hypothetical protein (macronuclear) [Paramecium tetraurelia strain d4-2]
MFANKETFEVYEQVKEIRKIYSQFKQSIVVQLEKLEVQIEKMIYEFSQSNSSIDQIYDNKIENENTLLNEDEMQQLISNWNKVCNQKNVEQCPKFNHQLVRRVQKTFNLWDKQIQELLQFNLEIIPRHSSLQYYFGTNSKYQSIKINEKSIIEQTQTQNHYCFAIIEQRLNQNETSSIQFKFPKFIGDIGVGICDQKILKSKDYRPPLNVVNNGCFVCFQDSYTINTEQEELNWKTKGFQFGEKDVIEVTYEPALKRVSWKKVQKPLEGYSIILKNDNRELHFCCIVKTQGAKVEIITE